MSEQPESSSASVEGTAEAVTGGTWILEEPVARMSERNRFGLVVSAVACIFSLAYWGEIDMSFALETSKIWEGQYWRFILSCLVHGDPIHLVFNVYWFFSVFSPAIETRYGLQRNLLLFVVLAIGSGAASYLMCEGGIGLSGVLYGYFGLILVAGRAPAGPQVTLPPRTSMTLIVWFVLCIFLTKAGVWNVGNVAHGAGLIIGAAMGLALRARRPRPWLVLVGLFALALAPATLYMPWDYWWQWERGFRTTDATLKEEAYRKAVEKAGDDRLVEPLLGYLGDAAMARGANEEAATWYERKVAVATLPEPRKLAEIELLFARNQDTKAYRLLVDLEREAEDPDIKRAAGEWRRWLDEAMHRAGQSPSSRPESPKAEQAASQPE